jgi:hypothetical protein
MIDLVLEVVGKDPADCLLGELHIRENALQEGLEITTAERRKAAGINVSNLPKDELLVLAEKHSIAIPALARAGLRLLANHRAGE